MTRSVRKVSYVDERIPVACTNSSGRILENGVYINRVLEAKYPESVVLINKLRFVAQRFGLDYGTCSLHYSTRAQDCQHLYSLFFDFSMDDFLHFVVNNGSAIQDLIDEYNFLAKDVILEAKSPENRVILPNSEDFLNSHDYPVAKTTQSFGVIHKITGLPMNLAPQRGRCLVHFLSGKSMKEISTIMQLSIRTVEHYLEMLRKELGCRNSKELILSYAHQVISLDLH